MEFKNKEERTGCMGKKQQDKHTGTYIIKTKTIDSTAPVVSQHPERTGLLYVL